LKELDRRLEKVGHCFEWADIKRELKVLQEITIEDRGKTLVIHSECLSTCGKVFQAVGVAIPPYFVPVLKGRYWTKIVIHNNRVLSLLYR
jgi:hypothetical protein